MKFEISIYTHYENMKGNTKMGNGMVWGSYGLSGVFGFVPFRRVTAVTCHRQRSTAIERVRMWGTVLKI